MGLRIERMIRLNKLIGLVVVSEVVKLRGRDVISERCLV